MPTTTHGRHQTLSIENYASRNQDNANSTNLSELYIAVCRGKRFIRKEKRKKERKETKIGWLVVVHTHPTSHWTSQNMVQTPGSHSCKCVYSGLPVTRTFKRNWKRPELAGVENEGPEIRGKRCSNVLTTRTPREWHILCDALKGLPFQNKWNVLDCKTRFHLPRIDRGGSSYRG